MLRGHISLPNSALPYLRSRILHALLVVSYSPFLLTDTAKCPDAWKRANLGGFFLHEVVIGREA